MRRHTEIVGRGKVKGGQPVVVSLIVRGYSPGTRVVVQVCAEELDVCVLVSAH